MQTFHLPDLGEGLPEAEIIKWHVRVGDVIESEQTLVSVETAKAVVDIPSPFKGHIVKLHGKPGDMVDTGAPLVDIDDRVQEQKITAKKTAAPATKIKAVPAARKLAQQHQLDLTVIAPTGPNNTITVADVEQALANQNTTPTDFITENLRGARRAMALNMIKAHQEVVATTIWEDADIQHFTKGTDIIFRIIRAIVKGCQAEPSLNAHFHSQTMARSLFNTINIGIAIDSDMGLFVPVIKNAADLTAKEIRSTIKRFKHDAEIKQIKPGDLKDATISLSYFGITAGQYANPIILPPTVAILGIGKIRQKVISIKNKPTVHRMMPLSLSIDHRAVTGGEATRFLKAVIKDLQQSS